MRTLTLLATALLTATILGMSLPSTLAAPGPQVPARGLIWAGLGNGYVYRSADGGASWIEADTGLPSSTDVTALAVAPGPLAIVYAGTSDAGVFSSRDDGRSWQAANGQSAELQGTRVEALAVDPRDPLAVYLANSDGSIYRTGDGGRTWSAQSLPTSGAITALVIDIGRPTTLFAGTMYDGLLVSTDGGSSWSGSSGGVPPNVAVNALSVDPRNPEVAYAATADGIYQTIDGGASWQHERRGIPDATDLRAVAVDPAHGSNIVAGSADGQFYRSTDGGTSWANAGSTDGRTITALAFDPLNHYTVLAGTADGSAFFISSDGGADWQQNDFGFGQENGVLALAAGVHAPLPTDPVGQPADLNGVRYFPATHHSLRAPFLAFWDHHGSGQIFGSPISESFVEDGQLVQYFERARLVWDGSLVSISPLGLLFTAGRSFPRVRPFSSTAGRLYFPATGHSLSGLFLTFWRQHQGSLVFGPPISEPLRERNGDGTGRAYLVQYCQNARLEYHPELSGGPYVVTLGLIGSQYLHRRGWL